MERSFVLVLTLVTLVTATPHGYGVKGGASAKAEASAVAGAFGDLGPIPLSIPSGSAYSGSFSKSSASSFASSSASSSSSSYSFSGSGANGFAGIGSDKGCASGTCPGTGTTGPSLNGGQHFTGANSVAQAKALSGVHTPCQGSNCNGSPTEKCASGQCLTDSTLKGQNGCTGNGNCQSPSSEAIGVSSDKGETDKQEGNSSDSNDFAVNTNRHPQSKLSHNSNGQYSNIGKSPESDCSNGQCGPANSDKSSLNSDQSKHPVPSTYLTTPNKNPPCTTPNCNYPPQSNGPQTGGLPSSYNVPIQSATNPPNKEYSSPSSYGSVSNSDNSVALSVPCTSPSCNPTPYNSPSNIPNHQFGQPGSSNLGPCASGQCHIPLSPNGKPQNDVVSSAKPPNYSHGSIPSSVPSGHSGQPGCTTLYCSGLPTYSSLPSNQPGSGCSGAACSSSSPTGPSTKPSDSKAPVYTGGFGGPAGFLSKAPGSDNLPGSSTYDNGHHIVGTNRPTGTNNDGSSQTFGHGGTTGVSEYNSPSSVPTTSSSQFNPSATGSYGASTTSTVPQGTIPHSLDNGVYKPTAGHTGSSPIYSGNTDGSTGLSHLSSGTNSIHGSFGVTKPYTPTNTLSGPTYTGGFGGPSGNVGGSSPTFGSAGSFNKPVTGNCGSAGCNGQSDGNVSGGYTSHDKTSPSASTSSQNKPVYTGGFGGPSGLLNPNNFNGPSNTQTLSSGNIPCANGNCGSKSPCANGNCDSKGSCANGNCDSKSSPSSNQGSSISNAQSLAAATASANAVVYSGGFGGPPGILKPYDEGKVNIGNGNFGNGHLPSSNNGQPASPSVTGKNSEPGSYTNGANAAAHASATASATAGSYGGNNNYQNNNGASRGCNSGCSPNGAADGNGEFPEGLSKNGSGAGSLASAKSSAGANAYGIGGNFASSSASAHASAGAATKGGYGKK